MVTDEQLVEAALQGTASAFDEIVERYQERLFRFLLTRSASRADAEDAIQDTFISAYRYLASFDARWRFSTWIYRIALRNLARQRKDGDRLWISIDGESPSTAGSAGPGSPPRELAGTDDPLQHCIDRSERENVWIAAKRLLTADAYAAMWLRYVEDMSVKEISRALDKSASWTKVTLLRGRRRLAAELADEPSDATQRENYGRI